MSKMTVSLRNAGKMYRMYPRRLDTVLEATGLIRFFPWRKARGHEFWALRNVNLDIKKGERLGIIGRNGAGKTTMLKLLTGNLALTEGEINVNGTVQALLTSGSGFHPEFTGYENIRSSLVYQGLNLDRIETAVKDIAEFTELGDFLNQPFKLYSAGMQARLTFATATVLNPDILIVDEILGAGDAYFFGKSMERMKDLVMSGATVLIVSHAMDQISRFCEEAVWLERGRVVARGPSLEIVKEYERFIRELENRRLTSKNYKRLLGDTNIGQLDSYNDIVLCEFELQGENGLQCDIAEINLLKGDRVEDSLKIGDVQDSNATHTSSLVIDRSNWSSSQFENGKYFRSLKVSNDNTAACGSTVFRCYALFPNDEYSIEMIYRFRTKQEGKLLVTCKRNNMPMGEPVTLLPNQNDWTVSRFIVLSKNAGALQSMVSKLDTMGEDKRKNLSRWPGEGSLRIIDVEIVDEDGKACSVFAYNSLFEIRVKFQPVKLGTYRFLPLAVLYGINGTNISTQSGEWIELEMSPDKVYTAVCHLDHLNLGNGNYVISIALYKKFDLELLESPEAYDWIDRSVEFKVTGTPPAISSIFIHPSAWIVK